MTEIDFEDLLKIMNKDFGESLPAVCQVFLLNITLVRVEISDDLTNLQRRKVLTFLKRLECEFLALLETIRLGKGKIRVCRQDRFYIARNSLYMVFSVFPLVPESPETFDEDFIKMKEGYDRMKGILESTVDKTFCPNKPNDICGKKCESKSNKH